MNIAVGLPPDGYFMAAPKGCGFSERELMLLLRLARPARLTLITHSTGHTDRVLDALYRAAAKLDDMPIQGNC